MNHNLSNTIKIQPIFFACLVLLVFHSCYREDNEPKPYNYIIQGPEDSYPAFSPCGEYIAYWHYAWEVPEPEDYPTGLYIIDREGGNRKLVLKGNHYTPSWSPCGQWLVFSTGGVIQKCKTNGDSLTTFTGLNHLGNPEFFHPHWTRDGRFILFSKPLAPNGGLYYSTSDFSFSDRIFGLEFITFSNPEMSPNNNVFVCSGVGHEYLETSEIFVADTHGITIKQLTSNKRYNRDPTWSPDGKRIAWSSSLRLCVMDMDGANQKQIGYGQSPSWSVNDEIVFSHANHSYSKEVLYIISPSGQNKRQITF